MGGRQGLDGRGWMAGKGLMSDEGEVVKYTLIWATNGS